MTMNESSPQTSLLDHEPSTATFLQDVLVGLRQDQKKLPSKYFYDEWGSHLFDLICELDQYYLTRTELRIMEDYGAEMARQIGPGVRLVEYGSGSSVKTRILLDHLEDPVAYVPVEISREHLQRIADDLSAAYPEIEILPVCADFTAPFELPAPQREPTHSAVYFPGSTIGNFRPDEAQSLLANIAPVGGQGGGLVLGVDLEKDPAILRAAYNDRDGVTAQFNLNLLTRINRELDGDFEIEQFEHSARFNDEFGRIEMHLVSRRDQTVNLDGESFHLAAGESICTEYSHKYTIEGFAEMAAEVGLELHKSWTDAKQYAAVLHFVVAD